MSLNRAKVALKFFYRTTRNQSTLVGLNRAKVALKSWAVALLTALAIRLNRAKVALKLTSLFFL